MLTVIRCPPCPRIQECFEQNKNEMKNSFAKQNKKRNEKAVHEMPEDEQPLNSIIEPQTLTPW